MASYVVQVSDLIDLIGRWEQWAREDGKVEARFRKHQALTDVLGSDPAIQWFYYCDDDGGFTFRLYGNVLNNQQRGWIEDDPYVIVRGEKVGVEGLIGQGKDLGPEGPTILKDRFLKSFSYFKRANRRLSPGQRIAYFREKNGQIGGEPRSEGTGNATLPSDGPIMDLLGLCEDHPQIILYGPPGTGKTRIAQRLAVALLEGASTRTPDGRSRLQVIESQTNEDVRQELDRYSELGRYGLVVFHPAYEYEQFVGGIAPDTDRGQDDRQGLRYKIEQGAFLQLCNKVEPGRRSVLVIDEINRGNLPKLLGELVYALEYRGHRVTLPFRFELDGSGTNTLVIPQNLVVIGTMNSSDRSIGHIDVAIRRRFALKRIDPDPSVVERWWGAQAGSLDTTQEDQEQFRRLGTALAEFLKDLNDTLRSSDSAGELLVGHSYFLGASMIRDIGRLKQQLRRKWECQVQPLLKEYAQVIPFECEAEFTKKFMDLLGIGE